MLRILFVFLLIPLCVESKSVLYAFQSVKDINYMTFVKENPVDRTILYINEKCRTCIASLQKIKVELEERKVTVVISTNNMNRLKSIVKKNASKMSGFIFYDPGRRFEKGMSLKGVQFSYVVFNGKKNKKYNHNESVVTKPPPIDKSK